MTAYFHKQKIKSDPDFPTGSSHKSLMETLVMALLFHLVPNLLCLRDLYSTEHPDTHVALMLLWTAWLDYSVWTGLHGFSAYSALLCTASFNSCWVIVKLLILQDGWALLSKYLASITVKKEHSYGYQCAQTTSTGFIFIPYIIQRTYSSIAICVLLQSEKENK